jgi:hypothetical protein
VITIPSGPIRYGLPRLIGVILTSAFGVGFGLDSGSLLWAPIFLGCAAIGWLVARRGLRHQVRRPINARLEGSGAIIGVSVAIVAADIGGPGANLLASADRGFLAGFFLSIWTSRYRDVEVGL